ncbi:Putative E3 ubiquitin-protein ligase ARI9 [Fusarium odoratissimum]|uniref:RBR-type E3 ubiquitin transferase n=1 Tax=Fusarium oxysporum f. sp. cubense (strain race 4) TaxID=2502994 RepID=N1RQZ5_FUSC4|nr:Putative E3 ubiquitin-protein ligase ARI9 [Fusarium odoratissimum]
MASQNGIFYGRADSAITSGFGDDESATAVQNPTSKSQGSSSSNTAQSQAIPSHERPVINTAAAAASSSSSSSASPCDECQENLEYNDIQRFADEHTIAKYERQALRAAVEEDENFFWCTSDCGSGQIHDSGSAQPIVVCIKCSHRSCFRHGVNWHEDLSCEEYDRLQEDPDFRGHLELENERWSKAQAAQAAQEEADRDLASRFVAKEKAKIKRQEAQDQRERERERERQKKERRQIATRRKMEEAKSIATLRATTKPCGGCGWAIEKNSGCSHMTCSKCGHEFCWDCGADHRAIMRGDNSLHKETCRFHPRNRGSG